MSLPSRTRAVIGVALFLGFGLAASAVGMETFAGTLLVIPCIGGWLLAAHAWFEKRFPRRPGEPGAFASKDELAADDPRRGWRGR